MAKENISSSIHHYRWVAVFCLVAVGYIFLGVLYYRYESQRIKGQKYAEISAIAQLKADSIQDWRRSRLADIRRVPGPLVKREMARLLQDPKNPSARAELQIQLNINKKVTVYADALFLNTKGNILLSDNPNPAPVDQATIRAIEFALKDRKEFLSDFYRDTDGNIYIDAVAPIPDNSGRPIAIVLLRTRAPDFLYPFIQSWPTPSKTAEILLACRDGDSVLFLNELRHRSNTALTLRFPLTDIHLPSVQAALGNYDRLHGRDYRGVDVLSVSRPVRESPWFIEAKVDADEILAEVKYRAWVVSIMLFLLILITAGIISTVYRKRQELERRQAEEALRQSEEKYRTLTEQLPDFVWHKDAKGVYVSCNRRYAEAVGLTTETIVGHRDEDFYPPEMVAKYITDEQSIIATGQSMKTDELWLVAGNEYWVNTSKSALLDGNDQRIGTIGIARDITERKQAEERILKLNRAYTVISKINQTIVRVREMDKLLNESCRIAVEYGKFRMAWIGMIDEETHLVKPIAHWGVEEGYLSKVKGISVKDVPAGRGPTGTAIREGRHFVCDDIENDHRMGPWRKEALQRGYRSSIALPIKSFGKVIGAFSLYASIPHFFDLEENILLDEVTNDISFAIESIETEKKQKEAETERRQAEEMLKASLREKDLLLNEIHHRVKNNLQVISGLLSLQAKASKNPELIESFHVSQNRIQAMTLVHEKLYDSKDFSKIGLAGYVRSLSQELFKSYNIHQGIIDLTIQTDGEVYVDINKAIPCGLILNELISNALKHAFPLDGPGELQIIIGETKEREIEIIVRDNGVGLPDDVDILKPRSVGLHLVNGLVKNQLDGQIEVKRDNGTEFRITFLL